MNYVGIRETFSCAAAPDRKDIRHDLDLARGDMFCQLDCHNSLRPDGGLLFFRDTRGTLVLRMLIPLF